MPVITARIPEEILEDVKKIEKEEQTDRAEAIRKLLVQAIKEWKIKKVLELLKEHKISYRKAAKMAGISYVDVIQLASKAGIDIGYTIEDLKRDLE
jgi:predicted HTH domain antitoxin